MNIFYKKSSLSSLKFANFLNKYNWYLRNGTDKCLYANTPESKRLTNVLKLMFYILTQK